MHISSSLPTGEKVHHNGDFSGNVKFPLTKIQRDWIIEDHANGDFTLTIPMEWIEYLVGLKLQDQAVSDAENKDPLDFVRI
jgi:hypothetical protein